MSKIHEMNVDDVSIINDLFKKEKIHNFLEKKLKENDIYIFKNGSRSVITRVKDQEFKLVKEQQILEHITGENKEQQILIEFLKDDDIKCVIVTGQAGTGKTIVSCAYAYEAVKNSDYRKLIISRVPVTPSKRFELGFIPGSAEEKLKPWLQVFYSTIDKIKSLTSENVKIPIENLSLEYIKGVTWDNSIIIIDEAEDLTKQELKTILTRVGKNSKILILGDTEQSTERGCKNTLTDAIKAFDSADMTIEEQKMVATVYLEKSLRSEFVNLVLKVL
jgi:PhoH-like ATPase